MELHGADNNEDLELAHGSSAVHDEIVANIFADDFEPGVPYQLRARAFGTMSEGEIVAETSFVVPDPLYSMIPMREGNHRIASRAGLSVAQDGTRMTYGGDYDPAIENPPILFDRNSGTRREINADIGSSFGIRISPDGNRFFYFGTLPQPNGGRRLGLGFTELSTDSANQVDRAGEERYATNHTGTRIAYQRRMSINPDEWQYFFQDLEAGTTLQLTDQPDAIELLRPRCPSATGTIPMMDASGDRIVVVTGSTLDMVGPDDSVGCRIFRYDVPTEEWTLIRSLPKQIAVQVASLSGDGRWLSMTINRPAPEDGVIQAYPALMDMTTGELIDPVAGIDELGSFDAVITADGRYIVISSRMDLDPRVGNADNNMELFLYDRKTDQLAQITETTGGIARNSLRCGGLNPVVDGDASVVAFAFVILNLPGGCQVFSPQRNEADDFEYRQVRAVRRRPGNRGPVWHPLPQARVLAGETLEIDFSAEDPDGDILSFFAQEAGGRDVPRGSNMTDNHDGTATFRWPTQLEEVGNHALRVAVYDEGGGRDIVNIDISVCSQIVEDGSFVGVLRALFGSRPSVPPNCRDADTNGDGTISISDLLAITS